MSVIIENTSCITPLGNKKETVNAIKKNKVQYGLCYEGKYSFEELLDLCLENLIRDKDINDNKIIVTANDINQEIPGNKIAHSSDIFKGLSSYISTYISNKYNYTHTSFDVSASCAGSLLSLILCSGILPFSNCYVSGICGGASNYHPLLINAFKYLHILSNEGIKPFGKGRDGTLVSQGMGFVNITNKVKKEHNVQILRNASFRHNFLVGTEQEGIEYALKQLVENEVPNSNNSVLVIDTHATGTITGDANEAKAIENLIKEFPNINILVTNTKSYFGHCMAASGIVELIILLEFIKENSLPLYRDILDEQFDLPIITEKNKKLPKNKSIYVLKHSSGLGGYDASVLCKVD